MSETEAQRDERRFDGEREVHDPACLALRLGDPGSCTCGVYDDHDHVLALAAAAGVAGRAGVTTVEPGCTCGGVSACEQCQERDAVRADVYQPKNEISDRWSPR